MGGSESEGLLCQDVQKPRSMNSVTEKVYFHRRKYLCLACQNIKCYSHYHYSHYDDSLVSYAEPNFPTFTSSSADPDLSVFLRAGNGNGNVGSKMEEK